MKKKFLLNILLFAALILTSCNLPFTSNTSNDANALRTWFDAPLPNTVVRPPNPCLIVAHGASPNGIALFELSINGAVSASIPSPDAKSLLVTLTRDCGLSQPGRYLLQMRVLDNAGQWSGFAETSLVIAEGEAPSSVPPSSIPSATEPSATLTPVPTFTPTAVVTGSVSIERVSTNQIYIGAASCGPLEVTILARATAPKGITVVVLFYRFATGSSSSEFQSVAMDSIGGDLYQGKLNPTSLLKGAVPFDQATLQYQVVVQQTDNDVSIRTPVMTDIAIQACGSVTVTCSSYTDKRSCEANGCNWVSLPGTIPVYACRNP